MQPFDTTTHENSVLCMVLNTPHGCTGPGYIQERSDGGGGISVYIPPPQKKKKNQSTLQIFMWLLIVVFLFDPGQIVVDFEIGRTS